MAHMKIDMYKTETESWCKVIAFGANSVNMYIEIA